MVHVLPFVLIADRFASSISDAHKADLGLECLIQNAQK
jgi:hypothetical protein